MPDPVRVVLLGNSFARKAQLPSLRWAGDNEVLGIAGRDRAKAEETAREWEIPHATDDYRELLALDPDLVIVSTPVDLHHPMVADALETRAAILCEKPFTLDVAEAEDLCERARGRAAWIDHELRWNPFRRTARRRIAEGALGEVLHVDYRLAWGGARYFEAPWRWWFDARSGGGVLGALGSHMLDLVRWELGEIAAVRCHLETFVRERADAAGALRPVTADDHAALWLRLASGVFASVACSVISPHAGGIHYQVTGRDAVLAIRDEEELLLARHADELAPVEPDADLEPIPAGVVPDTGPFGAVLPLFLRDVVRAVGEGRAELPGAATFEDGLATQRVLDAARRSSAEGGGWVDCGG